MPKGDHAIERRAGIEPADIGGDRRAYDGVRLGETSGLNERFIAQRADLRRRNAYRIEDRLATTPRAHSIARQRGVLAAIATVLDSRRRQAAIASLRCKMLCATARGGVFRLRRVYPVLTAAEELELPVGAKTAGARHAGDDRQGNHHPGDHGRKLRAETVHNL